MGSKRAVWNTITRTWRLKCGEAELEKGWKWGWLCLLRLTQLHKKKEREWLNIVLQLLIKVSEWVSEVENEWRFVIGWVDVVWSDVRWWSRMIEWCVVRWSDDVEGESSAPNLTSTYSQPLPKPQKNTH